jgi:uncharacterized protein (DUF4213/DUF364 family)
MYLDPLFDRGVTVLGGIAVHDTDELLGVVGEGGSSYFFGRWAEKVANHQSVAITHRANAAQRVSFCG